MTKEELVGKIIYCISDITTIPENEIKENVGLMEELDISSLEIMAIIGELEKQFQVKISEQDMRKFTCVQDIADYLLKQNTSL